MADIIEKLASPDHPVSIAGLGAQGLPRTEFEAGSAPGLSGIEPLFPKLRFEQLKVELHLRVEFALCPTATHQ